GRSPSSPCSCRAKDAARLHEELMGRLVGMGRGAWYGQGPRATSARSCGARHPGPPQSAACDPGETPRPMKPDVRKLFDLSRCREYKRPSPLVPVNGLAEQSESWFANRTHLSRHFDVKVPELLVYDGDSLHQRIDEGGEVTVDYLAERLGL